MTLEEHLTCPKCGYDLYGIPEVRCPECGFRYDAAALRTMAASAEWTRLATARELTVRATLAVVLALPAVCNAFGILGWAQFGVVAVAYVIAFWTWALLTGAYQGLASIPGLLTLFVAVAVGAGRAFQYVPGLALVAGVIALGLAWIVRLRDWPTLLPSANIRFAELRRLVLRYSLASTLLLIVASLLVLLALIRR